jgi:hypothetical protein
MQESQPPHNPYSSPADTDGADAAVEDGVGRDGDYLVVCIRRHSLADRCLICNSATDGRRFSLRLYWLSDRGRGDARVAGAFGPVGKLLAYRLFSKKAKLRVSFCHSHRWRRRRGLFFGWLSMPAALAAIGIATEHGFADLWILITIGVIGIVGTLYGYFNARRFLNAVLIYQGFVWVSGVCPLFLDGLPEVEQPRLRPKA